MGINLYFDANDIRIDSKGVVLYVIFVGWERGAVFIIVPGNKCNQLQPSHANTDLHMRVHGPLFAMDTTTYPERSHEAPVTNSVTVTIEVNTFSDKAEIRLNLGCLRPVACVRSICTSSRDTHTPIWGP
jgi:hypothetical protein